MRTISKLAITLCCAGALSYGTTWTAKLMDASCYDNRKTVTRDAHESIAKVCAPTTSTTAFAIQTSRGKVYKVDSEGNSKLANDFQSGTLKKDHDGDVHAVVTGKVKEGVVRVNSVVVTK